MGVGLETGALETSLVLMWAGSLYPWEPTWSQVYGGNLSRA